MNEETYYYHNLREEVRQYLRKEGVLKGSIALMALFYCAMEDIGKEEEEKKDKLEVKL